MSRDAKRELSEGDLLKGKKWNIVRDWNQLQGYTNPADEMVQIRRDLNSRRVSIENSSERPIGVAITSFYTVPSWNEEPNRTNPPTQLNLAPKLLPNFYLAGGEVKYIAINTMDGPMQYVHLLDPDTGLPVSNPTPFTTGANQFVLRDGIQKWWVQRFAQRNFRG
jgi:hypothetical protein